MGSARLRTSSDSREGNPVTKLQTIACAVFCLGILSYACGGGNSQPQTNPGAAVQGNVSTPASTAVSGGSTSTQPQASGKKLDVSGKACSSGVSRLTSPDPVEAFVINVCYARANTTNSQAFFGNMPPSSQAELKFISLYEGEIYNTTCNTCMPLVGLMYSIEAVGCESCPREYQGTLTFAKNAANEWQPAGGIILQETEESFKAAVPRSMVVEFPSDTVDQTDGTFTIATKIIGTPNIAVDYIAVQAQLSDGRVEEYRTAEGQGVDKFWSVSPSSQGSGTLKLLNYTFEVSPGYLSSIYSPKWMPIKLAQ